MTWRILCGDVREMLKTLPDGCVQTCVTSPPYWGLRDYGTAKWEGGDTECDHSSVRREGGTSDSFSQSKQATSAGSSRDAVRPDCRKCGAQRVDSQIGLESTPDAYVQSMVGVFGDVRRVLADDGTVWLNLGDSYAADRTYRVHNTKGADGHTFGKGAKVPDGLKAKDLVGIPWRVAFALQADGWYLRSDVIWSKPNPMPESVTDRPTKAHEYIFLLSKSARYFYDAEAIAEPVSQSMLAQIKQGYSGAATKDYEAAGVQDPSAVKSRILSGRYGGKRPEQFDSLVSGAGRSGVGEGLHTRNRRSVWTVTTQAYPDAHFATYPEKLIEPCILAGSRLDDTVLDPFCGSGTTGAVAIRHQRNFIGCELNPDYVKLAEKRIGSIAPLFSEQTA